MSAAARLAGLLAFIAAILVADPGESAAQGTITIAVGDIWFCDPSFQGGVCEIPPIQVGDTVVWDFSDARLPHTTTECGVSCDTPTNTPLWESGVISDGDVFQFTFTQTGTYRYQCEIHTTLQRGIIVVEDVAQEPTTARPEGTATPAQLAGDGARAATPTVQVGGVPPAGHGPDPDGSARGRVMVGLVAAGMALTGLGAVARRRSTRRREEYSANGSWR